MKNQTIEWQRANQEHLAACLEILRYRLERAAGVERNDAVALRDREEASRNALPAPSSLQLIETTFRLTAFERELVLLCAACELLPSVAETCATLHGDPSARHASFGVGLAHLQEPGWLSVTPEGPLRKFRLLEVEPGFSFTRSRIRVPERMLHLLCGIQYLEPALSAVGRMPESSELVPSHRRILDLATSAWTKSQGGLPILQLVGENGLELAAATARAIGLDAFRVRASELPSEIGEFAGLWTREALLFGAALVIDVDAPEAANRATNLARQAEFPCLVATPDRLSLDGSRAFDVSAPTAVETEALWRAELGAAADRLNGRIASIAKQFPMPSSEIRGAARAVAHAGDELDGALWAECKKRSRRRLEGLAERIEPQATWDDLVLPDLQLKTVRQIASHVRQRSRVYDSWGFAKKSVRGLGITALFTGPSGTGKTLAAEVIAGCLDIDLYRIDLSQVVSKYIGDTEKNLRKIFEAAEGSGAALLCDEADALFGKRSEVRDSHDRYANIEVGYLLQRMEAYGGLVILTTNMHGALDSAFMRRLRFVVGFPFPEFEDRRKIWERAFPASMPRANIDVDRLAELSLTGGNIRNIALGAAFLAAEEERPVSMDHLVSASRSEFSKLERPMPDLDARGAA